MDIIKAGNYQKVACDVVGISEDTLYRWKKEKPEFSELLKKANAEAQARNVAIIAKAASKQWQAAAWFLERKHHDSWGRHDTLNHGNADDKPFVIIRLPAKEVEKP